MGSLRPGENDLYTWCVKNGERGKLLLEEWNQEKNYNEHGMPVVPQEIANGSHKKCWWKCKKCGNDFAMMVASRTLSNQGCPKCGKKRGGIKNHNNALKNGNDLYSWCKQKGAYGKQLLKEWDYRRNMDLLGIGMQDVSNGSGKKVYWICSYCGKQFESTISHRTLCKSGCSYCNSKGTSFPEQLIYMALKQIYPDAISRGKAFGKIEYDICIPCEKLCIEYGGEIWHKDKVERDNYKRQLCDEYGVRFIQIWECIKDKVWEFSEKEIKYTVAHTKNEDQLYKIIEYIVTLLGHQMCEIDFQKAIDDAHMAIHNRPENSVAEKYPELLKEWDESLNKGLQLDKFTSGSNQRIKWKCSKCGFIWDVSIKSRTVHKTGCKCCGYNVFDDKIHVYSKDKNIYRSFNFI